MTEIDDLWTRVDRLSQRARASARLHEDDCRARDAAIYELADLGVRAYRIAQHIEMAPSHVDKIIKDEMARRQEAVGLD